MKIKDEIERYLLKCKYEDFDVDEATEILVKMIKRKTDCNLDKFNKVLNDYYPTKEYESTRDYLIKKLIKSFDEEK